MLLELSRTAFQNRDPDHSILLFCQQTRQFFHARGAYFWKRTTEGELVGARSRRLKLGALSRPSTPPRRSGGRLEAVRTRRTIFHNGLDKGHPKLAHYPATSVMSAPVIVSDETVGAITLPTTPLIPALTRIPQPKPRFLRLNSGPRSKRFASTGSPTKSAAGP